MKNQLNSDNKSQKIESEHPKHEDNKQEEVKMCEMEKVQGFQNCSATTVGFLTKHGILQKLAENKRTFE